MIDVIQTAKELIQIESTNPGAGEKKVEEYIRNYLSDSGAEIQLSEVQKGRCNIVVSVPAEVEKQVPGLVLVCHMDTVVAGKGWTKDPFAANEEDGRIYGRGACDMKSGLACALSVIKKTAIDVKDGRRTLFHPFRLICTVDEEGDMTGAEQMIREGYVTKSDWVLDLEPTGGEIQMAHKGRFWVELSLYGITAHASRPELGVDAVAAAAEMIVRIRKGFQSFEEHPEMGRSTVTFGQIRGGYQPYVVPDECKIWMDCRLAPPVTDKKVLEIITEAFAAVQKESPELRMEYRITGSRPFIEKNPESKLLAALKESVKQVCGQEKEAGVFPGYTDTAVAAGILGNKECLSYGPGDLKYAHKPDEFVEIQDIKRCEKVLSELVQRLAGTAEDE